jgi:hypothetical protein
MSKHLTRTLIVLVGYGVLGFSPAEAQRSDPTIKEEEILNSTGKCGGRQGSSDALCGGTRGTTTLDSSDESSDRASGRATPVSTGGTLNTKKYVPYNRLSTGPDGQPCATTGYVEEGTTPPDERLLIDPNPRETNIPITGSDLAILENYPPCPERPRAPGELAPVETRAMIAARHWERVPLPKPQPFIAPGRAITGKLAYLETRGNVTHTYRADTMFGPLEIQAKGSYTINWGDGETTGPYAFEGRSWPDGRITHDYLKIGTYDIVVTERWTANWRFADESGTLRALQTTGRIDDFPVEQIQAVIGR